MEDTWLQNVVIKTDKRENGIRYWNNLGGRVKVIYDGRVDDWSLPLYNLKAFDGIFVRDREVLQTILANQAKFVDITKQYATTEDITISNLSKRIT